MVFSIRPCAFFIIVKWLKIQEIKKYSTFSYFKTIAGTEVAPI